MMRAAFDIRQAAQDVRNRCRRLSFRLVEDDPGARAPPPSAI
jgi:hypothetical protein